MSKRNAYQTDKPIKIKYAHIDGMAFKVMQNLSRKRGPVKVWCNPITDTFSLREEDKNAKEKTWYVMNTYDTAFCPVSKKDVYDDMVFEVKYNHSLFR